MTHFDRIARATRIPEPDCVPPLVAEAALEADARRAVDALARRLTTALRQKQSDAGLVQSLIQEFALSSQEGVALMCLAEALLRIPDEETRDALIRDKIAEGDWGAHLGRSRSLFVNAAAWGLLITGRLVATTSEATLAAALQRLVARGGEPIVRKGIDLTLRMLGEQFVTGQTIDEAIERAAEREARGFRFSYDMLGEAALTAADAQRYFVAYEQAINTIGRAAGGRGVIDGPGISVKLSALHPRYCRAQRSRVMDELLPRLLALAQLARRYDIGFNIDAEESERLMLSLALLERLTEDASLAGWDGIGFVVQAYQRRAPAVVDWIIDTARRTGHRIMVRLVKGAYWDSEIKRAQVEGQADFPVYTRKVYTDCAYIACARRLLAAPDAVYPQFATHNAQTLATVYTLADPARYRPGQYELQCLHGMGEPLYEEVVGIEKLDRPCRIYAPVGTHETLLAYLVRRLLENGANSSFVNRIGDARLTIDELIAEPAELARAIEPPGAPHPRIAAPGALYGPARPNSRGLDLAAESDIERVRAAVGAVALAPVADASAAEVEAALARAAASADPWAKRTAQERAALLGSAADALQRELARFTALLVCEAGKSWGAAVAEARETIDLLRYYAEHAIDGEPLGPVVCISPWNFPLAIFTGQLAAALAAGNPVIAKPAEQTPNVAREMIDLLHAAGVPVFALQLLCGPGATVGAQLTADPRVQGVVFTGSTEVARIIQRTLAERLDAHGDPVVLIAETGGQNAMIVDSSALPEQVVNDVLQSAFDSAGQRCSALRVLCLQEEIADRVLQMLHGALRELRVGDPRALATDVGPLIDATAVRGVREHVEAMRRRGFPVFQIAAPAAASCTIVPPTVVEIDRIGTLEREVFGPVLHVVRWRREALDALLDDIDATGYALTLGVHSRIDETIERVIERARAGNIYVNRNMIGAVVGVQPFGGEGLSGTGPKAGGPLYVRRLVRDPPPLSATLVAAQEMLIELPGPTGERNRYRLEPRRRVLCVAGDPQAMRALAGLAVSAGGEVVVGDPSGIACDVALFSGTAASLRELALALAERDGPIVPLHHVRNPAAFPIERLLVERSVSINTAAAGGNANLMTLG